MDVVDDDNEDFDVELMNVHGKGYFQGMMCLVKMFDQMVWILNHENMKDLLMIEIQKD
jgi:hypothetical protein